MSVGDNNKYKVLDIMGRHFVEIGRKAGLGPTIIGKVIGDVLKHAGQRRARRSNGCRETSRKRFTRVSQRQSRAEWAASNPASRSSEAKPPAWPAGAE